MQNSTKKEFTSVNKILINSMLSYCKVYNAHLIAVL